MSTLPAQVEERQLVGPRSRTYAKRASQNAERLIYTNGTVGTGRNATRSFVKGHSLEGCFVVVIDRLLESIVVTEYGERVACNINLAKNVRTERCNGFPAKDSHSTQAQSCLQ